jgi:hypothetical protein
MQKGRPAVWAASSIIESRSPEYIEDQNGRKPHNDHAGADDLAYFRAHAEARTRIRSPFVGEFPRKVLKRARGRQLLVVVAVDRDAAGQPAARARGLVFADGGSA